METNGKNGSGKHLHKNEHNSANTAKNELPESAVGQGNILSDPHHTRADVAMVRSAIKRRWNIPSSTRKLIKDRLANIIENSEDEAAVVAASKGLIQADANDIRREANDIEQGKPAPQINVLMISPQELAKLPPDELIRRHRESLALPVISDDASSDSL